MDRIEEVSYFLSQNELNVYHVSGIISYLNFLENHVKMENLKKFKYSPNIKNTIVLMFILGEEYVKKNNGCEYSKLIKEAQFIMAQLLTKFE